MSEFYFPARDRLNAKIEEFLTVQKEQLNRIISIKEDLIKFERYEDIVGWEMVEVEIERSLNKIRTLGKNKSTFEFNLEYFKKMKTFDDNIKKIAEHYDKVPIFDGLVSDQDYQNSDIKIMWILKEANSTEEDESWDLREHILNELKTDKGILKGWSPTFKKIIYVTNGILNNLSWNDELYHPSYKPEVIDELKKIAFINIKKVGGGSVANKNELSKYYDYSKHLLFEQINEYNPNIIIFGGTYNFFHKDLKLEFDKFGSCEATMVDNTIYIDAYHPQYTIKEEIYFNDILKAVRHYKPSNV
mgnify:CR=1 FL=1